MTSRYDPQHPPVPETWLGLDEWERIARVARFHEPRHADSSEATAHATFHVVVENQIALGDQTPVAAAVDRLTSEGLDRHEALHAVGAVFAQCYFDVVQGTTPRDPDALREAYYAEVRALTAERWRAATAPE
jgi:hypothetical protein